MAECRSVSEVLDSFYQRGDSKPWGGEPNHNGTIRGWIVSEISGERLHWEMSAEGAASCGDPVDGEYDKAIARCETWVNELKTRCVRLIAV